MNVALIDNDLCTRKGSHFPNLALMKLSSYHKLIGDNVQLINIDEMDGYAVARINFWNDVKAELETFK